MGALQIDWAPFFYVIIIYFDKIRNEKVKSGAFVPAPH